LLKPKEIEYLLLQYAHPWDDEEAYRREIIESFVSEVYLYHDRLIIYYNIRKEQTKLAKSDLEFVEEASIKGFDQRCNASTKKKSAEPHLNL